MNQEPARPEFRLPPGRAPAPARYQDALPAGMARQLVARLGSACLAGASLAAVIACPRAPATAQTAPASDIRIRTKVGAWDVMDGTVSGGMSCALAATADPGGFINLEANTARPLVFQLHFERLAWSFPPGSTQIVSLSYAGTSQRLVGASDGTEVSVVLDGATFKPFLHGFTASSTMTVAFPADPEHPWTVDLANTTAAVTALVQCTNEHGFTQLPAPFTPTPAAAAQTFVALPPTPSVAECRKRTDSLDRLRCYDAIP